jgi:hypothetical protein
MVSQQERLDGTPLTITQILEHAAGRSSVRFFAWETAAIPRLVKVRFVFSDQSAPPAARTSGSYENKNSRKSSVVSNSR